MSSAALADLSTRLANLEVERKQLRSMFETMQSELSFHNSKLWSWKVSLVVLHNVYEALSLSLRLCLPE